MNYLILVLNFPANTVESSVRLSSEFPLCKEEECVTSMADDWEKMNL